MMITQNLLFLTCSTFFIPFRTCYANCTPSSCGLIHNIGFPFRLTNCGDPGYELVCENNVTSLYINSRKYYVKAIDYESKTIRLSDISPTNNNRCSIPIRSADDYKSLFALGDSEPIQLVSCVYPLHNSISFTQLTDCEQSRGHAYIMIGDTTVEHLEYMCTLDSLLATCWNFTDLYNVSLSEIHQSLLYGFNVSWNSFMCDLLGCSHSELYDKWEYIKDSFRLPKGPTGGCLMILMLILAVAFGGSIAAKIMITISLGVYFLVSNKTFWIPKYQFTDGLPHMLHVNQYFSITDMVVFGFGVRFVMGFLGGMGFLIYKFQRRHLSVYEDIEGFIQSDNQLSPIRYSYSDIKKMTNNFREKLGEGGFGSVYKGKLRSGHYVAVKLLGKAKVNDKDFINEIGTIGRIHHVNVVHLVGYCAERSKRILILDFMPNGSLDKYIFNPEKASSLDWDMKFKIAVGVARGIQYLHSGCDIKILHFDIKPHNILLDDKFVPKVSDFGLAKVCNVDKDTVTMTAARGTIGYVAPELINRSIGLVSHKADVYSFGMLLIEMAGVNRELRGNKDDSTKYFPDWIYDCINKGEGIGIGGEEDKNLDDEDNNGKSVLEKMTIVGLWCIQMNPENRPSMNKVLEMLEGDVEDLKIPEYPSQLVNENKSSVADSIGSVSTSHFDNTSSIEISIA